MKELKLELDFSEQESKDIFTIPKKAEDPILFDLEPEEEKKLSSRLYVENKEYPIPPEIKDVLEKDLRMDPLIRFVKNLKAVNSIPPSYRVFLLSNQYFDIIYEDYSLMIKVGQEEYYLGDVGGANLARKHINRLLKVKPMKTGDDEEDEYTG